MKNIIVMNGEMDWSDYFPGYAVHHRRIQQSRGSISRKHYGSSTQVVANALMQCFGVSGLSNRIRGTATL
jgi:hypothetical protein